MLHKHPKMELAGLVLHLTLAVVLARCVAADEVAAPETAPATAVTIILVRHAEAGNDPPRNPHLAPEGQQRAEELARVLGDLNITRLFASEYNRTRDTLSPLATRVGLEVEERSAKQPEALVKELRLLTGGAVAIVAGHSNTVPDLVRRLGGNPTGLEKHPKHGWLLPHDEYSRMFVITLQRPPGSASPGQEHRDPGIEDAALVAPAEFTGCLEMRYGAP